MSDFIEYPCINKHPCDWRNTSDESASDCTIILHNGANGFVAASSTIRKYLVHLRVLSLSSDYFYRVPMMKSQGQEDTSANTQDTHGSCQGCSGDLNIKFHDGKCIRIGSIKESFSALKKEIQERCGIPVFEQRLTPGRVDDRRKSMLQDWRSPAACEFREGDTLLLVHQPWQQYDSCTKTLELHLPELCARCVFEMRHRCPRNAKFGLVTHEMRCFLEPCSTGPSKTCSIACTVSAVNETAFSFSRSACSPT